MGERQIQAVQPGSSESVAALRQAIIGKLHDELGKFPAVASRHDYYRALALAVRDRVMGRWVDTASSYLAQASRTVCYLSAEFLLGPHLGNNLLSLGLWDDAALAVEGLGCDFDLAKLLDEEEEPGLGNGGLGRLAACYMDSLATLAIPAIGYGIRYEFGIFDQAIRDGWQVEVTDRWLRLGNPWEIAHPDIYYDVAFGGHTTSSHGSDGVYQVYWHPERIVRGTPYDTPILGWGVRNANLLRLWKAEAPQSFDFARFNVGDYYGAVNDKVSSENLSKVLYPNDEPDAGKELRLMQQYFFSSCSLQDMIRIFQQAERDLTRFHEKYVIQLNDTHPAVSVAELMRLLVDRHGMPWDTAWSVVTRTFAYTNHTLLPEALERWSLPLFARLLPRHLEIIYEINGRFLDELRGRGVPDDALRRLSIIDEAGEKAVRMANLACVGSFAINGVAALHTRLLQSEVLHDWHRLWPGKISSKTNGVTPRRFIRLSNPGLAALITETLGHERWVRHLDLLTALEQWADDPAFQARWRAVKLANKQRLAGLIEQRTAIAVDPTSLFDVLVKRIHEYKRQLLQVLHVLHRYRRLKADPQAAVVPRTFVFGGKAAPAYAMAKRIIKLVNAVGAVVNADRDVAGRLRVVFFPDFNVKSAHDIYPAADLSEQISMAGKEASGTGNMKFAMNGALTVGTLDGANIEIGEQVGWDNLFIFGLDADEVKVWKAGGYRPAGLYETREPIRAVMDMLVSGELAGGDRALFAPIFDALYYDDRYMVLADFEPYVAIQDTIDSLFRDPAAWTRRSILNVARMGFFSSDRAIAQYAEDIWRIVPVPIAAPQASAVTAA